MLEIKNLSVEVSGKEVLKEINLKLEKGKVYALMGPNGSGKSSLANTLMGNPKYVLCTYLKNYYDSSFYSSESL